MLCKLATSTGIALFVINFIKNAKTLVWSFKYFLEIKTQLHCVGYECCSFR